MSEEEKYALLETKEMTNRKRELEKLNKTEIIKKLVATEETLKFYSEIITKKDKVIDKMAENIASVDFDLCAYIDLTTKNNKCKDTKHCKDCIKQYFYKEVEEVGGEDE